MDPFRSAPIVAILPILVMWLGIREAMKIVFLFVGAVVYLMPMVRDAVVAVPSTYWISARDLGATPWEAIRHAHRHAAGIIVSISVMWTYITVAEYVNAKVGLGQLIQNARRFSAMDQAFVGIFVIIALALLTYVCRHDGDKKEALSIGNGLVRPCARRNFPPKADEGPEKPPILDR